jgi:two-component system chemotaxis response regulator CheB
MSIMKALPGDLKASVFIVQHIASGFARGFAQWLANDSDLKVRLAQDGQHFGMGEARGGAGQLLPPLHRCILQFAG